jgi:hypothetical protein
MSAACAAGPMRAHSATSAAAASKMVTTSTAARRSLPVVLTVR